METTAAVLRSGDGDYALETLTLAEPAPDQVLVRVEAAGMCHTDVVPRLLEDLLPVVTGHEGAGVVEAVGEGVVDVSVGDHVVLTFDSCGGCKACVGGTPSYCAEFMVRNMTGRDLDFGTVATDTSGVDVGARWFGQSSFARHCIATSRNVVVIDPKVPLEVVAPLGCGILTGAGSVFEVLRVRPGESLVVFGVGAVGMAAVMAAAAVGAGPVVAVDLAANRLELAAELGAHHCIDGSDDDVVEQVQALTAGGADHAFDTTGASPVILDALASLRLGGHLGLVGIQTEDLTLDPLALLGKQVSSILEGGAQPRELIPRLIRLWQDGRFPFDRLIRTYPLSEINRAEKDSATGDVVKPVLLPWSGVDA
jgi:aryl-alcohol dehydrogenase